MSHVTVWDVVFEYIKRNRTLFFIYCIAVLAMPINDVILPHFYGKVITGIQQRKVSYAVLVIIVVLLIMVQLLNTLSDYIDMKLFSRMHEFARTFCLDFLIEQKSKHLAEAEAGKILARIMRMPTLIYVFIDDWRAYLVPNTLICIFVIFYLAFYDWVLCLIIFVLTCLLMFFTFSALSNCTIHSANRDKSHNMIFEEVDEILRNVVSVLANDKYDYEKRRMAVMQAEYGQCSERTLWCTNKYKLYFMIMQSIALVVFILRAKHIFVLGKLTITNCISIMIIMLYLNSTMLRHTNMFKDVSLRFGSIKEVLTLFEEEETRMRMSPYPEVAEAISPDECLVIKDVSFSHRNTGKTLIKNLNLVVKCHENLAIVGEIGSGKSTVLKLLLRFYQPDNGEIFLNGFPYSSLSRQQVRKKIGYISQQPILFNRTLRENIAYGKDNASNEEIWHMIHKLNLTEHFKRYDDGLDTKAGKNGSNLSGGEKQIIWILRVLLQDPDIILLDEPTSAMDENTRDTVFKLLIDIMHEKTVIAVTHDKDLLKHFHRVVVMDNGRIVRDAVAK